MSPYKYPVPANPPADGTQHTCTFGEDWLALILDRVDDLQKAEWFDTPPSDIKQQIRELLDLLEIDTTTPPQIFPQQAELTGALRDVEAGNALLFNAVTGAMFGGNWIQSPPAIHDHTTISVLLLAGTYNLTLVVSKTQNSGILTVKKDGQTYLTQDLYNAVAVHNVVIGAQSFSLAASGFVTIDLFVDSKNAASSNYYFFLNQAIFRWIGLP